MLYRSTRAAKESSDLKVFLADCAEDGGLYVPEELPELSATRLQQCIDQGPVAFFTEVLAAFFPSLEREKIQRRIFSSFANEASQALYQGMPEIVHQEASKPYNVELDLASLDIVPETNAWLKFLPLNPCLKDAFLLELWHMETGSYHDLVDRIFFSLADLCVEQLMDSNTAPLYVAVSDGQSASTCRSAFEHSRARGELVILSRSKSGDEFEQALEAVGSGSSTPLLRFSAKHDQIQRRLDQEIAFWPLTQDGRARDWIRVSSRSFGYLAIHIALLILAVLLYEREGEEAEAISFFVSESDYDFLTAAIYVRALGFKIQDMHLSATSNRAASDLIRNGRYNQAQRLQRTAISSQDSMRPLNLERFIFELSLRDQHETESILESLTTRQRFEVSDVMRKSIRSFYSSQSHKDGQIYAAIKSAYERFDHLLHPSSALCFLDDEARQKSRRRSEARVILDLYSPLRAPRQLTRAFERSRREAKLKPEILENFANEAAIDLPEFILKAFEAEGVQSHALDFERLDYYLNLASRPDFSLGALMDAGEDASDQSDPSEPSCESQEALGDA
ncbi:MAG: hypothetical protein Q4P72_00540 [Eubacteriales bacterium]|nr:hypothetical protein [Eubacteriales bacterium]